MKRRFLRNVLSGLVCVGLLVVAVVTFVAAMEARTHSGAALIVSALAFALLNLMPTDSSPSPAR
jgi:hypothetical protein